MTKTLNEVEVRILGALVEKQVTTPEYYPLTLNSLTQACNQKNNRDPVVAYDEETVAQAIETLREKNLVYIFYGSSSRVPKYKHVMPEIFHLNERQLALMCVLMLRGPQTTGELRERASRLSEFSTTEEVEEVLNSLVAHEAQPFVTRLPRQPGQKEGRYAHLLAGEVSGSVMAAESVEPPAARPRVDAERFVRLEQEVEALRGEVGELRQQLEAFKRQFE